MNDLCVHCGQPVFAELGVRYHVKSGTFADKMPFDDWDGVEFVRGCDPADITDYLRRCIAFAEQLTGDMIRSIR